MDIMPKTMEKMADLQRAEPCFAAQMEPEIAFQIVMYAVTRPATNNGMGIEFAAANGAWTTDIRQARMYHRRDDNNISTTTDAVSKITFSIYEATNFPADFSQENDINVVIAKPEIVRGAIFGRPSGLVIHGTGVGGKYQIAKQETFGAWRPVTHDAGTSINYGKWRQVSAEIEKKTELVYRQGGKTYAMHYGFDPGIMRSKIEPAPRG